ncbi:hypothetical protein ADIARSV_3245 [Arcticibacter svalbardensis MN12-7]|uniref:Outer membrane protein n=1 Tax=Arcticibacter svalbardensis MN12-7 TaxID=1150600 RepID=R9GNW7_9SPHI|nr:RagB/SusD family nutrient uptake outer membrane protein [Arcticibacter svalbardensis]EOR93532.1 hypothetical protein ADIARSV_3245 [Arcticibacter svalbardensis MN12-7]
MKKIAYIITSLFLVTSVTSCKKFLTEEPLSQVATQNYFKSLKDVNAAMAGIYGSFQTEMTGQGGTSNFTGKYNYWGEARSDNFDSHPNYNNSTVRELVTNSLTSTNSTSDWTGLYRTIGRANTAIKYIPQAASLDNTLTTDLRDNNLAQCYAMRAICYFQIIRLWGDAPIWTEPYEDFTQDDERERISADKIISDIIIPDLEKAYALTKKSQTPNVWLIGEGAIAAAMADVYMWRAGTQSQQADYDQAIVWFKNVFKAKAPSGKVYGGTVISDLETAGDWKNKLFLDPKLSKEAIWSIYWDPTNNGCACIPVSIGGSNNNIRIDSVLSATWRKDKTDLRVTQTIDTIEAVGRYDKLLKYYNVPAAGFLGNTQAATTFPVYLVMYRLGDVYLSYAEALNKTGAKADALKYLNFTRQRSGLVAYTIASPAYANMDIMEDAILEERRYELFGEGKRWFDLVRTKHVNKIMDPVINRRLTKIQGLSYTDGFGTEVGKYLFPINRNVLEDNKKLIQNPFYL